jgi:hypothetical protein
MREQRLLQRHSPLNRRRRPGFFRVERPDQLWHMGMTSVWVAEHGWCYLNAAIDCLTDIPGSSVKVFAGPVPKDASNGEAEVIAENAEGRDLGRASLKLSGPAPQSAD